MEIIVTNVFSLLILTLCNISIIKKVYGVNFLGMEVLEMEDLALIEPTTEVGNLAYGDECRNNGINDITDDVCFHSNAMFQCLDFQCKCAYIRVSNEEVQQMVFQNNQCKRLENWKCKKSTDCANGLTCKPLTLPIVKKSKAEISREEDDKNDQQNIVKRLYPNRQHMKNKIKSMYAPNVTVPSQSSDINGSKDDILQSQNNLLNTRAAPVSDDESEKKFIRIHKRSLGGVNNNNSQSDPKNATLPNSPTISPISGFYCLKSNSLSILTIQLKSYLLINLFVLLIA